MQASIIASARRKKYAGPEPLVAVTASRYRSSRRSTLPDVAEDLLRHREVLVLGVLARRDHGHRLVHHHGDVRHHTNDRDLRNQVLRDERRTDPGRERHDQVLAGDVLGDLSEQRLEVLGLGHQHEDVREATASALSIVVATP